jgi:hypothetical protein
MRFMILVKANTDSEAGVLPSTELLEAIGQYNGALIKAGVLLAADGLQPSARGARVRFSHGTHVVTEGPFDAKELLAGYWIIEVKSKEEAIEWAKRIPFEEGDEVEVRQVFETADFDTQTLSPEVQEAYRSFKT